MRWLSCWVFLLVRDFSPLLPILSILTCLVRRQSSHAFTLAKLKAEIWFRFCINLSVCSLCFSLLGWWVKIRPMWAGPYSRNLVLGSFPTGQSQMCPAQFGSTSKYQGAECANITRWTPKAWCQVAGLCWMVWCHGEKCSMQARLFQDDQIMHKPLGRREGGRKTDEDLRFMAWYEFLEQMETISWQWIQQCEHLSVALVQSGSPENQDN